jgi:hypothetical protein
MTWLIVSLVICAVPATFIWRCPSHLEVLSGSWIRD